MKMKQYKDIDQYIKNFSPSTKKMLSQIRTLTQASVPDATEAIRYGIPTFQLNGKNLLHFAGYETHIGFYPGAKVIATFKKDLKEYNTSKGTVQFQLDKPLPTALLKKMIKACVDMRRNK
jgi:uncharacterized protein YdhG (YjbR/CyaY superfamily)